LKAPGHGGLGPPGCSATDIRVLGLPPKTASESPFSPYSSWPACIIFRARKGLRPVHAAPTRQFNCDKETNSGEKKAQLPLTVALLSKETHGSVKRDPHSGEKKAQLPLTLLSKETHSSVKRDPHSWEKKVQLPLTLLSKETHSSVKRDPQNCRAI